MEPAQTITTPGSLEPGEVRLSVPAHGAFLGLVRTTTAAVAARVDLTIDEIEDLRIAVDEAAALLLPSVVADGRVEVGFSFVDDELTIVLAATTGAAPPLDQAGFGWTVLAALAGSVAAEARDGVTTIRLTHQRAASA